VDCCIWLNLNFFTKRHATRVIYRLTVQTLPDGLETQFAPPDTTQSQRQYCLVVSGGRCELGISSHYLRLSTHGHSDRQALSTARFRRAGLLATADRPTCLRCVYGPWLDNRVGFLPTKTSFCQTWGLNHLNRIRWKKTTHQYNGTACIGTTGFLLYLTMQAV